MRLTDDVGCLGNFVKDQAADAAAALLMAAGCIVLTLSASVKMTLICLCLVPLVYVINGSSAGNRPRQRGDPGCERKILYL